MEIVEFKLLVAHFRIQNDQFGLEYPKWHPFLTVIEIELQSRNKRN